jgi:hypothetical protein
MDFPAGPRPFMYSLFHYYACMIHMTNVSILHACVCFYRRMIENTLKSLETDRHPIVCRDFPYFAKYHFETTAVLKTTFS